MFSKVKISDIANSTLNLAEKKFYGGKKVQTELTSRRHVCCEIANFKSRALSRDPSGDHVKPRAEVRNITLMSHLKVILQYCTAHPLLRTISHVISARALENGGFFFTAGPRHRSKSSFLRKRVW